MIKGSYHSLKSMARRRSHGSRSLALITATLSPRSRGYSTLPRSRRIVFSWTFGLILPGQTGELHCERAVVDGIWKQGIGFAGKIRREADTKNHERGRVVPKTIPGNIGDPVCRGCDHLRFPLDVHGSSGASEG